MGTRAIQMIKSKNINQMVHYYFFLASSKGNQLLWQHADTILLSIYLAKHFVICTGKIYLLNLFTNHLKERNIREE